jgi:hypothetical protein
VSGNFWHYNWKGFTYDTTTIDEYYKLIDQILMEPSQYKLSQSQLDLALSYLDVYFNQFPMPFPWGEYDFWRELNEWPVSRVMSQEGGKRFGPTLDKLIGRQ